FGSHGEVEMVTASLPRPRFQSLGIFDCASNCGPENGPATLSLRVIVGGCTGNVISIASDIFVSDFATASKRIFAGARSTSCTCRSEEHTSELQSLAYLVCRLLL